MFSTSGGYHEYIGGHHEYIEGDVQLFGFSKIVQSNRMIRIEFFGFICCAIDEFNSKNRQRNRFGSSMVHRMNCVLLHTRTMRRPEYGFSFHFHVSFRGQKTFSDKYG